MLPAQCARRGWVHSLSRKGGSDILRSAFISHRLIHSTFKDESASAADPWRRARRGQAPGRPTWRRPASTQAWGSWVVPPRAAKHRTRYKRSPRVHVVQRGHGRGPSTGIGQHAGLDCRVRQKRCSPAHVQNPLCKPSCPSAQGSQVDSVLTQAQAEPSFHKHTREENLEHSRTHGPARVAACSTPLG